MTKSRGIRHSYHRWTPEQEAHLRAHYADTLTVDLAARYGCNVAAVWSKATKEGLLKSKQLIAEMARACTADPTHGARQHQFKPGQVSWNKGKPGSTGLHPNSKAVQFRKGMKPHTEQPIGSYRICGGRLARKVNDLPGANNVRWHPVSRLVWEEVNGPVPAGHKVVFKPGRQTTELAAITLDAVELLSNAQMMLRNSITNYPPELADLCRLRGQLKRAINQRTKEEQQP